MSVVIASPIQLSNPPSSYTTGGPAVIASIEPLSTLPKTLSSTGAVTHNLSVPVHHLQEINNTLSSYAITTPPTDAIPLDDDEYHYTLTQCSPADACNYLNHASMFELLENQHRLPFEKMRCIQILDEKRLYKSSRYQITNYFPQCCLMTLLDQNISTQVCLCGLKKKAINGINPTGLCNRKRLCYPCANTDVKRTLSTFQPRFHHHQWGFLTISYNGQLPLNHLSGSEWTLYWDAAKSALKRLVATGGADGAMWREELAIPSLTPTSVIPHLHAIVPTGQLGPEALIRLREWALGYRDDLADGIEFEPSIDFRPIPEEDDFVRIVQYLHKPIDLVTPYVSVWDQSASATRKVELNRVMRDLIEAVIMNPKGRSQIDYAGNMRAASKTHFIGIPKCQRR